jgi:predicted transcriptional regulator YdeE
MEPSITTCEAFTVLGIQVRVDPMKADYQAIWNEQYAPHAAEIAALASKPGARSVFFDTEESAMLDMVAGMAVAACAVPPAGLVARDVPEGLYAVAACTLGTLGATWLAIYREWLPTSAYEADMSRPCYEYYAAGEETGDDRAWVNVAVKAKE